MSTVGGSISLLLGTVLVRLWMTGVHQRYVRVGMGPWLAVAGVVVIVLGIATLERTLPGRHDGDDGDHDHGDHDPGDHGHAGHSGRVGWLLLAPVVVLLLVAPPALGSYGVDRGAVVDVTAGAPQFDPLDPATGPVDMTLTEFSQRAFDNDGATFAGAAVRLTGFVADDEAPFRLARYQIACCAVDAAPVVVRVTGTVGPPPRRDRWVTVTGAFDPDVPGDVPTLAATSVAEVPAPDDPYE